MKDMKERDKIFIVDEADVFAYNFNCDITEKRGDLMLYSKTVILKDGRECLLRNADGNDAEKVLCVFNETHAESENMLTYPEENCFDVEGERKFLEDCTESENTVEIGAFVGEELVGTAGIEPIGTKIKVKHRADFGVGVLKRYSNNGIGKALTEACIECAKKAGYLQVELEVVSTNEAAIAIYKKCGFIEYGRNPRGFRKKNGEWQELVLMRLELD